jgi:leucyl aminopeptidase (aminopeptidase T)
LNADLSGIDLVDNEPQEYWERALKEAAHVIVTSAAGLRKRPNVLVICGAHNKILAKYIMLEAQRVGAIPFLWEFNEDFFLESLKNASEKPLAAVLDQVHSLAEKSNTIIWLSQFEDVGRFPANVRKVVYSFWDDVYAAVRHKPRLLVNLPSPKTVRKMRINYLEFLAAFINGVKVDYAKMKEVGLNVASTLSGKNQMRVSHANGTDLEFSIEGRHVGVESGALEDCYSVGKNCGVDVPGGEVYVAPIETSANGTLIINEHREYGLKELELVIVDGRITEFKAEKGYNAFRKLLENAEGNKDRIAEFGAGINCGVEPVGWSVYDEKALGTAHIAIGNNIDLGGVNEASIHVDFVLDKPIVEADGKVILRKGRFVGHRMHAGKA